jgi:hypothetical protein
MLKFGVVPPDEIIGPLAVTLVTVPFPLALNVVQSVLDKNPFTLPLACVIENVLFADKSPPPCNGADVDIDLVKGVYVEAATPVRK